MLGKYSLGPGVTWVSDLQHLTLEQMLGHTVWDDLNLNHDERLVLCILAKEGPMGRSELCEAMQRYERVS